MALTTTDPRPANGIGASPDLDPQAWVGPNANLYLRLARDASRRGDLEHAFVAYTHCVRSWELGNRKSRGRWADEESAAREELLGFMLGRAPTRGNA